MLRNIDPPLGFGKKCPERLAYKKLIRMNMPMDFEGKVRKLFLFASTIPNLLYLHSFLAANIFIELVNLNKVSKFYLLSKKNQKKIFTILPLPLGLSKIFFVLSQYNS